MHGNCGLLFCVNILEMHTFTEPPALSSLADAVTTLLHPLGFPHTHIRERPARGLPQEMWNDSSQELMVAGEASTPASREDQDQSLPGPELPTLLDGRPGSHSTMRFPTWTH